MKVAILGFSSLKQSESLPIYRYFKQKGAQITAYYWGEPDIPNDVRKVKIEVGDKIEGLDEFDLIVRGPAVHPRQIQTTTPTTTLTNIFVEKLSSKNIIGVTGTKGKGTTSTLIAKMLEVSGHKTWLGGNIGQPLLDNLEKIQPNDWVVLEMSAGQLIDFGQRIHVGVCVMVVPEHLDWHKDMDEYVEAKSNLFRHQKNDDIAIYFAKNDYSEKIASYSPGKKIPYYRPPGAFVRGDGMIVIGQNETEIIPKSEVKLLGEHNLQNICAACTAVYEAVGSLDKANAVLSSFSGLEHRLELVREFEGVKYYNDSFAATPDAVISALKAIPEPKIMIIGGFDRNLPISHLAKAISGSSINLSKVILIGASGNRVAKELENAGFKNYTISRSKNMPDIVSEAAGYANKGEAVVLSPGFPSFDMFKNFEDRGLQFKSSVERL